jgi:3-hydroxy-9,10-secoandrosta-1,3,5(10)-triene-9,17-dione monooxygenase reductase component
MDAYDFRQLCGRFATGIAVVTARDGNGQPAGMTVNSFASVSLDPPLVSIAIDHAASMHGVLQACEQYTINILESHQEALSRRFASGQSDRFEGIGFPPDASGRIVLDGTLAHLSCERVAAVPAGDHTIFIGRVVAGAAAEHGRPLLYYRGGYADPESV